MKAAIMGYGTIGSGVYEVLDKNCKSVEKKAGEPIEVKYILDLREFPGTWKSVSQTQTRCHGEMTWGQWEAGRA